MGLSSAKSTGRHETGNAACLAQPAPCTAPHADCARHRGAKASVAAHNPGPSIQGREIPDHGRLADSKLLRRPWSPLDKQSLRNPTRSDRPAMAARSLGRDPAHHGQWLVTQSCSGTLDLDGGAYPPRREPETRGPDVHRNCAFMGLLLRPPQADRRYHMFASAQAVSDRRIAIITRDACRAELL